MTLTLQECPCCASASLIGLQLPSGSHSEAGKAISNSPSWKLCGSCGYVFQSPRPTRAELESAYADSAANSGASISPGYIDFAPHQLIRFLPWLVMNAHDPRLITNGTCLDFGCGIGGSFEFLANQHNSLWGVEIDRSRAAFGNEHFHTRIVPTVEDLPRDVQYDLIFANHAIEHIYDPNDFFSFAGRSLKSSGSLIVAVPAWRYGSRPHSLGAFGADDMSVWDHIAMASWLNKYGLFMTSYLYQHYGRGGDWELCVTAVRSPKKNHFFCSIEETIREFYSMLARGAVVTAQEPQMHCAMSFNS